MVRPTLHVVDMGVIGVYLALMLATGLYFMRRQKSATEFLLASRDVGFIAIGLSLLSSLNSALDYVVGPASYMEWGLIVATGLVGVILAFPIVFRALIPFYQRLPIFNCYEYLELRFDGRVRATASAIFILWRICWMAFTIYLPAYALNIVLQTPVTPTIVGLAMIATIYTALGGARAVIWTDVLQAVIMLVGLVLAIVIAVRDIPGGFTGVWDAAASADLLRTTAKIPGWESASTWEKISLYLHFPVTALAVILSAFISQLNNYGADQVMVQRYLSAKSLDDCKKGFLLNAVAYVFYMILFAGLSMSLLAYFQHHPIPSEAMPEVQRSSYYFPYFIGTRLPIIIKGLVIVSIYAAAQSSVSAGVNAVTSVLYTNFFEKWARRSASNSKTPETIEREQMLFNRLCTVAFGVIVTIVACFVGQLGESLFGLANKIVSNFAGVMIPVFLLGMFSSRARSLGTAVGAICGVTAMFVWGFGHHWGLFEEELGYQWTIVVGFVVTVAVCYVLSMFEQPPSPKKLAYLWKNVMARPPVESTGS